jgi:hypothetical protein
MWRLQQNESGAINECFFALVQLGLIGLLDLEIMSSGWNRLQTYHGRPNGMFAADEYLAGLEAIRGTELCAVVEMMYSANYIFQVTGDVAWLDRLERIAFNALPATLTADMWQRQYLQQQNQIAAKNMEPNPFPRDG